MTMPTQLMQRAHDEVMAEDGPTLPDKPRRRTFTAEYKLAIVEEYDACAGDGDKGALLRRKVFTPVTSWSGDEPEMLAASRASASLSERRRHVTRERWPRRMQRSNASSRTWPST